MILLFIKPLFFIQSIQLICALSIKDQEPNGIHLRFGSNENTQVFITWWTRAPISAAFVYYGAVDMQNDQFVSDEYLTCNNNLLQKGFIGRNATADGKYVHQVYLKNLLPNRRYCYEVTSGHASSHIFTFRTPSLSIELGIKSDTYLHSNFLFNGYEFTQSEQDLADHVNIHNENPLSYVQSIKEQTSHKSVNGFVNLPTIRNDIFYEQFTPLLSNIQLITLPKSSNQFYANIPQMKSVLMPDNQLFKSFNTNGVHFIIVSLESLFVESKSKSNSNDSIESSENMYLLKEDLISANENRHLIPWIVLILAETRECDNCDNQKLDDYEKKIESLLYEHNVDLIFESSDELYERSYPCLKSMKQYTKNYENVEMPIRISLPRRFSASNHVIAKQRNIVQWTAESLVPYGASYGLLEVINTTTIEWSFINTNYTLIDKLIVHKNHNEAFERMYEIRKHFLETNERLSEDKLSQSNQTKVKSLSIFIIGLFLLVSFALIAFIGYVHLKRHFKRKLQLKFNSNYSNLIESEFDALN